MTKTKIYQVDAFTSVPFKGNPAGVCILDNAADELWMQNAAAEMNLAETAFLYKTDENTFNLRWFTPECEVDLCGHATLATTHILIEKNLIDRQKPIDFHTKSGLLTCNIAENLIEMNFPTDKIAQTDCPEDIIKSLGINPIFSGKGKFDYLVEVESASVVEKLSPDFNILKKADARGVIVTSKSANPKYDFVSRFFAPAVGINEDPVTGSSHCSLAYYWANKLKKNELKACQVSKRSGELDLKLINERVLIKGQATTVIEGYILH